MHSKFGKLLAVVVLMGGLFASHSFAATIATAAVTPSITVPGGKVFIHTALSNLTVTNEAVTVALNVTSTVRIRGSYRRPDSIPGLLIRWSFYSYGIVTVNLVV